MLGRTAGYDAVKCGRLDLSQCCCTFRLQKRRGFGQPSGQLLMLVVFDAMRVLFSVFQDHYYGSWVEGPIRAQFQYTLASPKVAGNKLLNGVLVHVVTPSGKVSGCWQHSERRAATR
jgi:hypothetical protein